MADTNGANGKLRTVTWGDVIAAGGALGLGLIGWGALNADFKALAQRVEKGEARDDKTGETLDAVKGAIIELRVDGKASRAELERQGRQLDRIEGILRTITAPPYAPQRNPATP